MDMTPDQIASLVFSIIGVLSVVAAITPTPVDNAILIALRKILDAGAFNVFGAKNAAQVEAEKFKRPKI